MPRTACLRGANDGRAPPRRQTSSRRTRQAIARWVVREQLAREPDDVARPGEAEPRAKRVHRVAERQQRDTRAQLADHERPIDAKHDGGHDGDDERDQVRAYQQAEVTIEGQRLVEVDDADVGKPVDEARERQRIDDVLPTATRRRSPPPSMRRARAPAPSRRRVAAKESRRCRSSFGRRRARR